LTQNNPLNTIFHPTRDHASDQPTLIRNQLSIVNMSVHSIDLKALCTPPDANAETSSSNGKTSILKHGSEKKTNGEKEADGEKEKPPDNGGKQIASTAMATGEGTGNEQGEKLSNAELKKRAKAEKAAKRAQAKEGKSEAVLPDLSSPRKLDTPPEVKRKNSAGGGPGIPAAKSQQKQNVSLQKNVPLRPAVQSQAVTPAPQPETENKNVALFGHLYSHPRRTSIAGAGKDVHPVVLALGLQMSNYVICGSNARCVAMLLVFKRVRTTSIVGLEAC